jgi:hypothetical protein
MARLRTPHCTVAVRAGVDLQDAVELGQRQRHAQRVRQRAARQPGAGAARHHRHLQRVAGLQHGGHLRLGLGQRHHQRLLAVGGEAVALVGHGVLGLPQQRVRGQQRRRARRRRLALALGAFARRLGSGVSVGGGLHDGDCSAPPMAPRHRAGQVGFDADAWNRVSQPGSVKTVSTPV